MPELAPPAAITAVRLQRFASRCDYLALAPHLERARLAAEISTPRRVRHWMAQLSLESAGLTRFEENLNYGADRLVAVWPKRFPTLEAAAPYAHNPQALANRVYGGRLGNTGPDDGWRYRGRSPVQVTGRANYAQASAWAGVDLVADPDPAATPAIGCRIAAEWWRAHGLNQVVDADPGERPMATIAAALQANELDDVLQARRVINGGEIGLEAADRLLLLAGTIWKDA